MSTSSSKHFLTALAYVIDAKGDVTEQLSNPSKLGSVASARIQLLPAIKAAKKLGFDHKGSAQFEFFCNRLRSYLLGNCFC